jgi:hypothetical protein
MSDGAPCGVIGERAMSFLILTPIHAPRVPSRYVFPSRHYERRASLLRARTASMVRPWGRSRGQYRQTACPDSPQAQEGPQLHEVSFDVVVVTAPTERWVNGKA